MLACDPHRAAMFGRVVACPDEDAGDAAEHRHPENHDDEQEEEPSPEQHRRHCSGRAISTSGDETGQKNSRSGCLERQAGVPMIVPAPPGTPTGDAGFGPRRRRLDRAAEPEISGCRAGAFRAPEGGAVRRLQLETLHDCVDDHPRELVLDERSRRGAPLHLDDARSIGTQRDRPRRSTRDEAAQLADRDAEVVDVLVVEPGAASGVRRGEAGEPQESPVSRET